MKSTELCGSGSQTFFISRAGAEAEFAGSIARIFEREGHTVLLQQDDVVGQNFGDWMHRAIAGPARVVALLSPAYLASEACRAEWINSLAGDWLNSRRRLIVLRADYCDPVGLLAAIAYWDLVEPRRDRAKLDDAVLSVLQDVLAPRSRKPVSAYWRPPRQIVDERAIRAVPSFTGREAELGALRDALRPDGAVAVIHGLGGVGKSALVREYARRERHNYSTVWSVEATSDASIVDGVLRLAAQERGDVDRRTAARELLAALPRSVERPALLIYDDLADEDLLREWMPPPGVRLLASSRNAAWSDGVSRIYVTSWSAADGVRYLRAESGREYSDEDAGALVDALGGLPLALSHAAAYLKRSISISARTYVERIERHLARAPKGAEYDRAVFATFVEAIATAERESPGSAALMCIAGFFAPIQIPEVLFAQTAGDGEVLRPCQPDLDGATARQWAELGVVMGDTYALDDALGVLHRLSLIRFSELERTFDVHRLVQAASRTLLNAGERSWAHAAVRLVTDAFPEPELTNFKLCGVLFPHALAVLDALAIDDLFPPAGTLARRCGGFLSYRASYADAEVMLRRSLRIMEAVQGPRSLAWSAMRDLGVILAVANKRDEADTALRGALALAETDYGVSSTQVADVLSATAFTLREAERAREAESLARRATALRELIAGSDDPEVARSLNMLGVLARDLGALDEAEASYRRAIEIETAAYGERDPRVALTIGNLALMLMFANRLDEAEVMQRRALDIHLEAHGPENIDVANDLNNLATILYRLGRYEEAEGHCRQALMIDESFYGPLHPRNAIDLATLGDILYETGRAGEAETCYRRAMEINDAAFGADNVRPGAVVDRLSRLLARSNRFDEVDVLQRRALANIERHGGANGWAIAERLFALGYVADSRRRFDEGTSFYARAISMAENAAADQSFVEATTNLGAIAAALSVVGRIDEAEALQRRVVDRAELLAPKSEAVHSSIVGLISIVLKRRSFGKAEQLCRHALAVAKRLQGGRGTMFASDLNLLAEVLYEKGEFVAAEALLRRSLAVFGQNSAPDDAADLIAVGNLGELMSKLERFAEAEPVLRRALELYEQRMGLKHERLTTVLINLGDVLSQTGRVEEGAEQYGRAADIAETAYGGDHPVLAAIVARLAAYCRSAGRLVEAEGLWRRVLAMHERRRRYRNVAESQFGLAQTLLDAGGRAEAEDLFASTLDTLDGPARTSDEDDWHRAAVAEVSLRLGELFLEDRRYDDCERLFRRALDRLSTLDDISYDGRATLRGHLVSTLRATGRTDEAEHLLRLAAEEDRQMYGRRSVAVAVALVQHAQLLATIDSRDRAAEKELRRALAIFERKCGRESGEAALALTALTSLEVWANRSSELESLLYRTVAATDAHYGAGHAFAIVPLERLGAFLANAGRATEAENLFCRALAIAEDVYGPQHREVASILSNLGFIAGMRSEFRRGRILYARAIAIDDANGDSPPSKMVSDRWFSAVCASRLGDLDDAESDYQAALTLAELHPETQSMAPALRAALIGLRSGGCS